MKTVLIVEDDNFFREALKNRLEYAKYNIIEAPNGKVAKDIILAGKPDVILSDIQMPHFDGLELLKWSKEHCESLPFILMTGFSHILETQSAFELGADGFVAKPFPDEELLGVLKEVINKDGENESPPASEPVYCKVSIEDFVSDKEINLDIFIKLSEKRFIKIAHKGGKLDEERVENYKQKGINDLYIKKEDFSKVIDFNIKLSKLVAASSNIPREKKDRFLVHTGQVILEKTFVAGVDEESFSNAKDFLNTSIDLLTQDDQTFHLLDSLNSHTDFLYAHSLGVSIYSVMIAKKMGWKSSANLFKLSFAGLMHDVGKKEIDPKILLKSRPEMTYEERNILETHTTRGKTILESLKSAPSEAVAVAYEHHEDCLGQGYPRRTSKHQIHPMALIVSIANEFCNYAIVGPNNPGVPGKKAIFLMEQLKKEALDSIGFQKLKELFN